MRPYSPEYAQTAGGEDTLREWAGLGGGALLDLPANAFVLNAPVAASRTDLFPFLLALAALLLPFDVGVRRITVSLRQLFGVAQGKPAVAKTDVVVGGRVTQLMQAKARTTDPTTRARTRGSAQANASTAQPNSGQATAPSAQTAAPVAPTMPPQAAATASELLKRRKKRAQGEGAGDGEAESMSKDDKKADS